MYLYIGYEMGFLKHIKTTKEKIDNKMQSYECHSMEEVIYYLMEDERTRTDIIRRIDDNDVFILDGWHVTIAHNVLINSWGSESEIWIENENGELELL